MTKAPAFLWYPRDFQADEYVKLMSYEQEGIYRALLDHAWLHGSIPADLSALAKILGKGLTPARLRKLWPGIALCWQPAADNRLVNCRQERDRERDQAFRSERSSSGHRGSRRRWERSRPRDDKGSAIAQPLAEPIAQPSISHRLDDGSGVSGAMPQPMAPLALAVKSVSSPPTPSQSPAGAHAPEDQGPEHVGAIVPRVLRRLKGTSG